MAGGPNLAADHDRDGKLSSALRKDASALIGEKLNPSMLDEVARRIRKEFHARTVEHHVLRGKSPEYVQVVFEVKLRPTRFDVSVPKFLYSSKQTWSGAAEATATVGHNGFTFGLVSDGDELAERYSGMVARYENNKLGSDRVRFRFQFENYHEQWNPATQRGGFRGPVPHPPEFRAGSDVRPCQAAHADAWARAFEQMESQFPAAQTEVRQRPDFNSALSPAVGGFGKPARPGRRVQPARGHHSSRQRFRLRAPPSSVPVHADAREERSDRRSDRRA